MNLGRFYYSNDWLFCSFIHKLYSLESFRMGVEEKQEEQISIE